MATVRASSLVLVVGVLLLISAPASATTATAPGGTAYTGTIATEAESSITFHGQTRGFTCVSSKFDGSIESHGAGVTAKVPLNSLSFNECDASSLSVIKTGTLEIHAVDGYGTVTSSGAEFTVELQYGFSKYHCVLATSSTDIGTTANPSSSSEHAVIKLEGQIPVKEGSGFCGSSFQITGSYRITTPTGLRFDSGSDPTSTLTAPSGTAYSKSIEAQSEGEISFFEGFVTCGSSSLAGGVEQQGSVPAIGTLSALSFSECTEYVEVLQDGAMEYRATSGGNGTLISSGAELKITFTLFGIYCILRTHHTDIGALTAAPSNSGHAVLDINGSIPVIAGSEVCGTTFEIEGTYKVTSPTGLRVD
ncbi:MAG TPA: hypothetical protein VI039_01915 [Solirubrobacterales bacterium]